MAGIVRIASAIEGVEEGIACAGTPLESRTFHVKGKTFLFVSATQARLKLAASAGEARQAGYGVGATGWVILPLDLLPPVAILRRWIAESHALVSAPKARAATRRAPRRAP